MDVLEALVRDTLADHADDAPPATYLLEAVTARRHPRTRWLVLGTAAAMVLLAVAVSVAAWRAGHRERTAPAGSTATVSSARPGLFHLPDKTVAYHGVVVTVPGNLPVLTNPCDAPGSYVLADDPNVSVSCTAPGRMPRRQDLTVTLDVGHGTTGLVQRTAPASGTYFVTRAGVTVTVAGPTLAGVRHILATVRVAADPNGCSAQLPAVSNPPARHVVAGHPETLTRCVYASAGWLQASLPVRSVSLVAERIDALPPNGTEAVANPDYEHDVLRFGYADGTSRSVAVNLGSASLFSDGNHVLRDSGNRVTDLIRRMSS